MALDTFDGSGALDTNDWIIDAGDVDRVSGVAQGTTGGDENRARWSHQLSNGNFYVQGNLGSGLSEGLITRINSSATGQFYLAIALSNVIGIYRANNGSYTNLANTASVFSASDTVRFETEGSSLRVYVDGSLSATTTDSNYGTGAQYRYGGLRFEGSGTSVDNFEIDLLPEPALAIASTGTIVYATGSTISPSYPAVAAGDMGLLLVGVKPDTATISSPGGGWSEPSNSTFDGGAGSTGADSGPTKVAAFTKTLTGSESGSVSVSLSGQNVAWAVILTIHAGDSSKTIEVATHGGVDTSANTSLSITAGADPGHTADDLVIAAWCRPTDANVTISSAAYAATGATFGSPSLLLSPASTSGNDIGGRIWSIACTGGTSSGAPTLSATLNTGTNNSGPAVFVRFRAVDSATDLEVDDLTLSLALDAPTLTQTHELEVADLAIGLSTDAPTLTQLHQLTVDDIDLGLELDEPEIEETAAPIDLIVADLAIALSTDSPGLTQLHQLAVDDLALSLALDDGLELTQVHQLAVDDVSLGLALATPTLTQLHELVAHDLSLSLALDPVNLSGTASLTVHDLALGLSLDAPGLTQAHQLQVDDIGLGLGLDGVTLTQGHALAVHDLALGLVLDASHLTQLHELTVADLALALHLDSLELTEFSGTRDLTVRWGLAYRDPRFGPATRATRFALAERIRRFLEAQK